MGIYTGTNANEIITPNAISATVTAAPLGTRPGAGPDTLFGSGGNDTLDGGAGADALFGGTGDDTYVVDDAGDVVTEADTSEAGGADTVLSTIAYTLGAGLENLTLQGADPIDGAGNDLDNTIFGNSGDNLLEGFVGDDTLNGGEGNDKLIGGQENDTLKGAAGDDTLLGGKGLDLLNGGQGDDTLKGNNDDDQLIGGAGFDLLNGGQGDDTLKANTGDDQLIGGVGFDLLNGGGGDDALKGGGDDDTLAGVGGADTLKGNQGKDILDGGKGIDTLVGGAGDDEFVFAKPGHGGDLIRDFRSTNGNQDMIVIETAGFQGGLVAGQLSDDQFQTSDDNVAEGQDVRFIFDTSDNTLWFDQNGSDDGGLRLIADLQASASLEANDILLV